VTYVGRAPPAVPPAFTLEALNNPILAWAELESYAVTGDRSRLAGVWDPLVYYYEALQTYLRQGNGLYVTDFTSMDNSPRNHYLQGGGTAIDTSAQMALFARDLSQIAAILGKREDFKRFDHEAQALSEAINRQMWSRPRHFYFDLTLQGAQVPVRTIAAYWTLLARVASSDQAADLVKSLEDDEAFGRPNAVPTLGADEPRYYPKGGAYWRGAVWAPTTMMVIRGLEAYGYDELARRVALQHVDLVSKVYKNTGTIWENYSPESAEPGKPAAPDFVGWSGLGPIRLLLEYGVGLKPDAPHNRLTWNLPGDGRVGCERYRFGGRVLSLLAEPLEGRPGALRIRVDSDGEFRLKIIHRGASRLVNIVRGSQEWIL
jgi:glycogen debranching enzyme